MLAASDPVAREINPVFNSTLVVPDVLGGQRLELRVKDIGIMTEQHFGGRLGPVVIARCTFPVGEDINGFLELVPVREVPRNGAPLVQLTARFREIGALAGNTSALVEVWEQPLGSGVPALGQGSQPTAPLPEQAMRGADVEPAAEKEPEPLAAPASSSSAPFRGSGVFAVAPGVFDLPLPILKTLENMQATGERGPLVSAPFLSYDVLGCGYDPLGDTYGQYWAPIADDCMPPALDVVMEQFKKHVLPLRDACGGSGVSVIKGDACGGSGVSVINRFLTDTKEPLAAVA